MPKKSSKNSQYDCISYFSESLERGRKNLLKDRKTISREDLLQTHSPEVADMIMQTWEASRETEDGNTACEKYDFTISEGVNASACRKKEASK